MKEHGRGVDVIINDIQSNPRCTHGPTVLFERFNANGTSRRYYACSACRDKKDCVFYHQADQKYSEFRLEMWQNLIKEAAPKVKHEDLHKRLAKFKKLPAMERSYCLSCSALLGPKMKSAHSSCTLKSPIFDSQLSHPSLFLPPKENAKLEAQYMFSQSSVEVIMGMLNALGAKKVLCLGTPRIFEAVSTSEKKKTSGLLMDIDNRYGEFFSPSQYVHYNMFNHHFFEGDQSKQTYQQFLTGNEKLVVVSDPPFGGRMELLANSMLTIEKDWRSANKLSDDKKLSVLFIFPYFMEPQVLQQLTNFVMLDYQVDYDNHILYASGPKGMFHGSAVRVYVNDRPSLFVLPEQKGYMLCKPCDRWVRTTNIHCEKCKGCMSKDGRTYNHCDECNKCVKPSWIHCSKCEKCQQQDHRCGEEDGDTAKSFGCHICGEEDHKRKDCPNRKRSIETLEYKTSKKQRVESNPDGNAKSPALANKKTNKVTLSEEKKNVVVSKAMKKNSPKKGVEVKRMNGNATGKQNGVQNKKKKGKMNGNLPEKENTGQNKKKKGKINGNLPEKENTGQNKKKKGKVNGNLAEKENADQKKKKEKMNFKEFIESKKQAKMENTVQKKKNRKNKKSQKSSMNVNPINESDRLVMWKRLIIKR